MAYRMRRSVGVAADVVCREIERINDEHGGVKPEVLLDESRPEDAPLHPAFTWDDSKAGELWRLVEARNIIRSVHVVDDASGEDMGCAFVRVSVQEDDATESVYRPVTEVVQDPDMFRDAVAGLKAKLAQSARALQDLENQARKSGHKKRAAAVTEARLSVENATQSLGSVA